MVELRRILCPVDFSDVSRHAFDHAVLIAGWYGSHITALHVSNPLFLLEPPILFAEFRRPPMPSAADRPELEARLHAWLEPARVAGLSSNAVLEEGNNPAAHILECAASLPADLIVIGTHGRGGFERLVLGSVTEKVLRKATCPVLTVPPATTTRKLPFKRLLCPVDFSESSLAALRFALSIAKESDARLTMVHVFEWPSDDDLVVEQAFDVPEYRRQREEQTRQQLEALVSADERSWCQPTTMLSYGKPYERILGIAENEEADLIVMGVHGRNAIDMMLFGSTTNQVVRRAVCPVLTLRQ